MSGFNDKPTLSKRHLQWLESLKGFNSEVYHTLGNKNTVADILSRRGDHYPSEEEKLEFNPFPEDKMFPIEQLEISAMEFGLDHDKMCEALEWAFCCAIESDSTLIQEIEENRMKGDLEMVEGRMQ